MSKNKNKKYSVKNFIFVLTSFIVFQITSNQDPSIHEFPLEIYDQNNIPTIPISFKDYSSTPKLMILDINIDKSWIFEYEQENKDNNKEIIDYNFYTLLGKKNKETIYIKDDIIENFNYLSIYQIKGENYYPGALSLNKKINEYNIVNKLKYEDENIINNKYFGFCLDFNNKRKLYIGNMYNLNNDISKLIRLPIYQDDEEKGEKWSIKLNGLFLGSINTTLTEKTIIENKDGRKTVYNINRKYNKGLIVDESANIETIYNSIYVTKEAMLFLIANYFKGKEKVCIRQEFRYENNYEIKFNCFKNKKNLLKNINLILDNNITLQLTPDDLLNCAINQNINNKNENMEMCEFNIKYNNKIDYYILGLSVFKKYITYFLFNDNSVYLEGNDNYLNCYLKKEKFSNISRNKKRSLSQTIKELFSTTLCISFIFALLAGSFYLYDKYYGKIEYIKQEEAEKIINRDKYANL